MLIYKLNKQIDSSKFLTDVQSLINKSIQDTKEYLLVVKVQEISYNDDTSIPKLIDDSKK